MLNGQSQGDGAEKDALLYGPGDVCINTCFHTIEQESAISLETHRRQERQRRAGGRDTSRSIGEHEGNNASLRPTTHFDVSRTDHHTTDRQGDRIPRLWTLAGRERARRDGQGARTKGHTATRKRRGTKPGEDEQRRGIVGPKDESQGDRVEANTRMEDRPIRDSKLRWE